MKKINLRGISEILSERELKSVVGGVENHMSIDFENPDYALDGGVLSFGAVSTCGSKCVKDTCENKKHGDVCFNVSNGFLVEGSCKWPTDPVAGGGLAMDFMKGLYCWGDTTRCKCP